MFFTGLNILAYSLQEKMIFFPVKLPDNFQYSFARPFSEVNFFPEKEVKINALWFKNEKPQGVIFYLHGNAGSLRTWGDVSEYFLPYNYDVVIIDYRGYGKSRGKMSEENLYKDAQYVYDSLKTQYREENIVVYGRSIGTGMASYIASVNKPGRLILETPYYNFTDLVKKLYPIAPAFILKYKFPTDENLPKVSCPVLLMHGTQDEVVYYESSLKLKALFKEEDELVTIEGGMHNNLAMYKEFHDALSRVLKTNE